MKGFIFLIVTLLITLNYSFPQSIVIPTGASIYVPSGADICAGSYGHITGNIYGEGTQCGQTPVPVELTSFTAESKNTQVLLKWTTETEVSNYGFEIERASSSTTPVRTNGK